MKKVIMFTENNWAFGSIHNALAKLLFKHGYDCEIVDFFVKRSPVEMQLIDTNTDFYITSLPGASWLRDFNIDPKKIYAVAHGEWDILLASIQMKLDFNNLGGYFVVSNILKQKSAEFGIQRIPDVTPVGIFFDRFYTKNTPEFLSRLGYAAAYYGKDFYGNEIKRGSLASKTVCELNDIESKKWMTGQCSRYQLVIPGQEKFHYMAMPRFYTAFDCLLMTSTQEGAGLCAMEAAAAGRLVIGTPVGYFIENASNDRNNWCGGISVPIPEEEYIKFAVDHLLYYSNNPNKFSEKCKEVQEYARMFYDWSNCLNSWLKVLP